MIDTPAQRPSAEKIVEDLQHFDEDEFNYFLENDPELQSAYLACLHAAAIEWTDEDLADCVYRTKYGDRIDDLMQYWRFQRHLRDAADPEHTRAVAVHIAVMKGKRRQAANPRHTS